MNFKKWLEQSKYINLNNPYGDFARQIIIDPDFPNAVEKYIIAEYIFLNCGNDNLERFNIMYADYIKFISRDYSDEEV